MAKNLIMIVTLLVLFSMQALAAGGIELMSIAEVEISTITPQGEKEIKRIPAAEANVTPGDTVIFTTTYINLGEKPATNVVINNPVPEHMLYLDKSAAGVGTKIEFSIDKGKSFGATDKLIVKKADGKERPALASDYTHIRWTIEGSLAKNAKGEVSYRAKVK